MFYYSGHQSGANFRDAPDKILGYFLITHLPVISLIILFLNL